MSFEDLLDQACKSARLPEMARILLPSTLSEETKKLVLKLNSEEFGAILKAAITVMLLRQFSDPQWQTDKNLYPINPYAYALPALAERDTPGIKGQELLVLTI